MCNPYSSFCLTLPWFWGSFFFSWATVFIWFTEPPLFLFWLLLLHHLNRFSLFPKSLQHRSMMGLHPDTSSPVCLHPYLWPHAFKCHLQDDVTQIYIFSLAYSSEFLTDSYSYLTSLFGDFIGILNLQFRISKSMFKCEWYHPPNLLFFLISVNDNCILELFKK